MDSPTLQELRSMTDDQLVETHDNLAKHTGVGTQHFLDEIARREQTKQTEAILSYTRWMTWLTVIITVATIINVIIAFLLLRHPGNGTH
jgi:hypothetical protein